MKYITFSTFLPENWGVLKIFDGIMPYTQAAGYLGALYLISGLVFSIITFRGGQKPKFIQLINFVVKLIIGNWIIMSLYAALTLVLPVLITGPLSPAVIGKQAANCQGVLWRNFLFLNPFDYEDKLENMVWHIFNSG